MPLSAMRCRRANCSSFRLRAADCRALTAGALDHGREATLDAVRAGLNRPAQRFQAGLVHPVVARSSVLATSVEVIDLTVGGVRVTLIPAAASRTGRSLEMQEEAPFL